ncbi:hypothetical protein [Streptomyces purpurascens]|uniref:hypothetical protein n=1 Tax=Streptomyces purpurascens TaxID=1924 RepID=UPI0019A246F4|nr:hypothetical protein [Streptomyces purpurascens]GHA26943.1 hypothetical protein GCM10010303_42040 [Streptomyces purpurascens]
MGAYVAALRRIAPAEGPTGYRGVPLATRDRFLREALAQFSGRIDTAGVGDPAVDLISAWCVLPAGVRGILREAADPGEAEWARGRGWALSIAVIALPYYWETNPPVAENSRHVIREILAETA